MITSDYRYVQDLTQYRLDLDRGGRWSEGTAVDAVGQGCDGREKAVAGRAGVGCGGRVIRKAMSGMEGH